MDRGSRECYRSLKDNVISVDRSEVHLGNRPRHHAVACEA